MNENDGFRDGAPDASGGGEAPSGQAGLPLANAIGARNLMIIIVTMPLVFLIVVMATLSIFGAPGGKKEEVQTAAVRSVPAAEPLEILDQPAAQAAAAPTPASAAAAIAAPLILPAGSEIGAMALDGDRLAVRILREGGGEIVVFDLASGDEIRRIRIVEEEDL